MLATSSQVTEKACCRIDFAGGTVDLWPIYLYCGGLELVQMGIQVRAQAKVTHESLGQEITIHSLDLNLQQKYSSLHELGKSLELSAKQNPLRWVNRLVHYFLTTGKATGSWKIETSSETPPGSGLGGSSVLGVAVAKALAKQIHQPRHFEEKFLWSLQQTVRDLEAAEIEFPAGDQDYVPGLFGGLLIFKMGVNQRSVERLSDDLARELGARTALIYTGKPHHSGINNWDVFKKLHHRDEFPAYQSLKNIRNISAQMASELRQNSLKNFASLLNAEWSERMLLSPQVNAPVFDEAWAYASKHGATARKGCGAGGGGCMVVYFEDAAKKNAFVSKTLPDTSWKFLDTTPLFAV